MSDNPTYDQFIERYRKQLGEIDEVARLILNAHSEVEAELDEVLKAIFFHPQELLEYRLSFMQKVQMAKAYAIRQDKWPHWRSIKMLNEVRNEVAHGKKTEKRTKKIAELRAHIAATIKAENRDKIKSATEEQVVVTAAAVISGYLLHLRDSILSLREHIAALDAELFPDEPRVPLETNLSDDDDEEE